jgi:hypothetical protein
LNSLRDPDFQVEALLFPSAINAVQLSLPLVKKSAKAGLNSFTKVLAYHGLYFSRFRVKYSNWFSRNHIPMNTLNHDASVQKLSSAPVSAPAKTHTVNSSWQRPVYGLTMSRNWIACRSLTAPLILYLVTDAKLGCVSQHESPPQIGGAVVGIEAGKYPV